jgi:hypothetical protein
MVCYFHPPISPKCLAVGQPTNENDWKQLRLFPNPSHFISNSEHKETKLSRGVRRTVWKRIWDRNEALDLVVVIVCLLDVFRSQIDPMSGSQIVQEDGPAGFRQPLIRWPIGPESVGFNGALINGPSALWAFGCLVLRTVEP